MGGNKGIKNKMIRKYGAKCFIEELHLRDKEDIEREKRFYGKKQIAIMDELTYHHIIERSKGGRATEENGAILRNINHQWFNRLSKEQQRVINQMFQEYKRQFNKQEYKECSVRFGDIDAGIEVKALKFEPDEIFKENKKQKYNRAKVKKEFDKKINEGYMKWEDER